ncbi:MAG: hypothetical protein ACOC0W_08335 [Desulfosalsimonas sp.]
MPVVDAGGNILGIVSRADMVHSFFAKVC